MENSTHPTVPILLKLLANAYQQLNNHFSASAEDQDRLATVLADFHWYAQRFGEDRWQISPHPEKWSFFANLWHITEQAMEEAQSPEASTIVYFIDHGKEHVGQAAELFAIFESNKKL